MVLLQGCRVDGCRETLAVLSRLARVELGEEECDAIESMKRFFSRLSEAAPLVLGVEPLHHVWEKEANLGSGEAYQRVDVAVLNVEVEERFVRFPWRRGEP